MIDTVDLSEVFRKACYNLGYEIDEHYSGRCMYGSECHAVRTDDDVRSEIVEEMNELFQYEYDIVDKNIEVDDLYIDSMGLGVVIYTR